MPSLSSVASDLYAGAGLLTLAVHATAVETGAVYTSSSEPWGINQAIVDDMHAAPEAGAHSQDLAALLPEEALHQSWGWDLVKAEGVLPSLFQRLGIDEDSVQSLLDLPASIDQTTLAEAEEALKVLVLWHANRLDPELEFQAHVDGSAMQYAVSPAASDEPEPVVGKQAAGSANAAPPPQPDVGTAASADAEETSLLAGSGSSDGSDRAGPEGEAEAGEESEDAVAPLPTLQVKVSGGMGAGPALERCASADEDPFTPLSPTEGAVAPEPAFSSAQSYEHMPTPESLHVLQRLVNAAIQSGKERVVESLMRTLSAPQPQPEASGDAAALAEEAADADAPRTPAPAGRSDLPAEERQQQRTQQQQQEGQQEEEAEAATAEHHLYDARVRTGLKRVAHWLCVPRAVLAAMEAAAILEAAQDMEQILRAFKSKEGAMVMKDRQSAAVKWAKISGGALGVGALLALTGGLAAPALAAGFASALSLAGGAAAAHAGGVLTAFGATHLGIGVIAGGFGAAGGGLVSRKMYRLMQEVKDFMFVEIRCTDPVLLEPPPSPTASSGEREDAESASRSSPPASPLATASAPEPAEHLQQLSDSSPDTQPEQAEPARSERAALFTGEGSSSSWWRRRRKLPPPGSNAAAASSSSPPSDGEPPKAAGKQEKPRRSSWAWPWSKKVDPAPAEGSPAPSESASSCPSAQGDVKTMGGAVMQPFPLSMHRNATTGAVMTGTAPGTLIACSGWIVDDEDFVRPWRGLRDDSWDAFALCWEPAAVRAVGNAMMSMIAKEASKEAAKWFVSTYVSAGLIASLAWPIFILNAAGQIDNAWTLAMDRADQAGKLLACILAEGLNGGRPVTLVGYSLGGKLVFECLCELDRMGSRGLVEHAIILGAPVNGNLARWAAARRVVSGRLVNGYSSWDWLLAVAYRSGFSTTPTTQFYQQVAGLSHISARGVQNINLGDHIARHTDYVAKMPELLKLVGLEEQHGCRDGSTHQTP